MEIQCQGKADEIYQKLKTKFQDYKAQGRLRQITDIEYDDSSCSAILKGSGFTSKIKCQDDKILIDLDLSFLLKPLRSQIEAGIKQKVTEILA